MSKRKVKLYLIGNHVPWTDLNRGERQLYWAQNNQPPGSVYDESIPRQTPEHYSTPDRSVATRYPEMHAILMKASHSGVVLFEAGEVELDCEPMPVARAIELAKECAERTAPENGSARLCLGDAYSALASTDKPPFGRTHETQAMRHALRSLSYSVGILSPIYLAVRDEVKALPDFDPKLDTFA